MNAAFQVVQVGWWKLSANKGDAEDAESLDGGKGSDIFALCAPVIGA